MLSKKPMTTRRSQILLNAQELFNEVIASPLSWPGKTIRLERNSAADYRQRSMSAHISIAELYHENSKLFPQMLSELTISFTQSDEFRREFLRRRAIIARARGTLNLELDHLWRELLSRVVGTVEQNLFYALELRLLVGSQLAIYEPVSEMLQIVKQLSIDELNMLKQALQLMSSLQASLDGGALLFILGSFARNDVLFGSRGYRRTLLEAGHLAQEIVHQARQLGLVIQPFYEFTDRDVDAAMEADGIEQGTIMAFELGGSADVS